MELQAFLNKVLEKSGKPTGWPATYTYNADEKGSVCTVWKGNGTTTSRGFDVWTMAFVAELEKSTDVRAREISLYIDDSADPKKTELEALRRRVSYLQSVNPERVFALMNKGKRQKLDDLSTLLTPRENEVLRGEDDYAKRGDEDKGEKLEKDFQCYLYGKGLDSSFPRNDRMTLLGTDFYKSKGRGIGMHREFPSGVFELRKKADARVLPTNYVDIVTLNKYKHLSIIELKVDDPALEVIAQLLDYALFVRTYYEDWLKEVLKKCLKLDQDPKIDPIMCYVASNLFHSRFDDTAKFYSPKSVPCGFRFVKLTLGHTQEI